MAFDDFREGAKSFFKERFSSIMYASFLFFWCISNWKAIYISLFLSEENILKVSGMNKLDFLLSTYDIWYWNRIHLIILPILGIICYVWIFPYIEYFISRQHLRNKIKIQNMEYQELKKQLKEKEYIVDKTEEIIEREKAIEHQRDKIEEENSEKYHEDYKNRIKKDYSTDKLRKIIGVIYSGNGQFSRMQSSQFYLNANEIADLDTNNIITIKNNIAAFTSKGKYFVKEYQNSNYTKL